MATATAPPVTPKTTTSAPTNPIYQAAVAQAKAALAAAQQPIQDEQAQSDAAFKQRQTDATGEAASLAELLKGIGPTVQGAYSTAAQNQGLLANGFSDGMKDKLQGNTDSLNAMLAKLGSPTQLDSHAQQAGDVLYGLGGYNPGSTFNREGAAFGAAADMLPGTALLKGQENVKSLQGQAITADQGFQNKLAEMAGQLPGQIQDNYSKLQTLALNDQKFALAIKHENFTEAMAIANNKLAAGRLNLDSAKYQTGVSEFNARQTLSYKQLTLQSQKFARQVYTQDRAYQVSLARLGIAQKSLQLRVAAQEYKLANNGFTPTQMAKFQGTLQKDLNALPANGGYVDFLRQSVADGVPLSLAIQRANAHWPETQRPDPGTLSAALDIPQKAAAQASQWNQTVSDYNQTVGIPGKFERVDQGVDYLSPTAVRSLASGRVMSITKGMAGGTGDIIKVRLDKPIVIHGRAYYGIYYSEESPLVRVGQKLDAGVPVMRAGGNEIGFLDQKMQMAPLKGGLGSGTQPSVAGQDFQSWLGAADMHYTGRMAPLKQYAFSQARSLYGWSGADFRALDSLWTKESGWNPNAKNPKSGALGIPQALGHQLPPGYAADPQAQIDWGINYIKQRYGTPSKAWQHETRYGWY